MDIEPRTYQQEEKIQQNVSYDVQQLDGRKLDRPLLITQVGERYTLEGIEGHHTHHHGNIVGMVRILQQG